MTVDDARAEQLASKASAAAHLTSSASTDIQSLYTQALQHRAQLEQQQDDKYLSLAPTFLSLHQQATSSKQLLSSLEAFLSTFQADLSTLSTHISALQTTSHQIDSRLDATRDVEIQLASFLSEIALSPRIVDLFFDSDPETRPELWHKAVKQLEHVLEATSPSAQLSVSGESSTNADRVAAIGDVQAVKEVRAVAEACKNVVASKLRTYLTAPHASIKASVTTNLQVLQTSVLLRHHRPFYAFLARQIPRVAIDVQRSYVAAARLYFETAFRRYSRSLGVIRKRWAESSGPVLITDPLPSSSGSNYAATAVANLQSSMATLSKMVASNAAGAAGASSFFPSRQGGSSTPTMRSASQEGSAGDAEAMNLPDPWLFPATRLQYSKLESPAGTVLGYLADEPSFRACPENLLRSLSLVLIDNACSEYTFLVRFFEGVGSDDEDLHYKGQKQEAKALGSEATLQGVEPDESASAIEVDTTIDEETSGPEPSVVQLSLSEQSRLKGRGASEEIFKQIMEPSITTWTNFTKSLLTPSLSGSSLAASASSVVSGSALGSSSGSTITNSPAGYFSLLSMLQLNDALLGLITSRGCSNAVVEMALMGFKIQAYPLLKRFLDDQISAISHLSNPSSSSSSSSTSGGMWNVIGSLTGSASTNSVQITEPLAEAIAIRYTSLFTKTLWIQQDNPDQGILNALTRLRSELAKLLISSKTSPTWSNNSKSKSILSLIQSIEATVSVSGSGLSSHPKVQNEFSFWNEQLKSIPA